MQSREVHACVGASRWVLRIMETEVSRVDSILPSILGTHEHIELSWLVSSILALYVVTSLTIPFWVPIVKRLTGDCGVFWVFSVLTYYAYLAWLIFALLLLLLLYRVPSAGLIWLAIVAIRIVQFLRLGSRSPGSLHMAACVHATDEEAPLPFATEHANGGGAPMPRVKFSPAAAAAATCVVGRTSPVGQQQRGGACAPAAASCLTPQKQNGSGACGTVGSGCTAGSDASALGRVLLVGNGPSIRERGLGCEIDSFDTVVRFNSFVTKGLEEHTGSKTSLWCHMMQWYHISTVEVSTAHPLARGHPHTFYASCFAMRFRRDA